MTIVIASESAVPEVQAREQFSNLYSLFVLSMMMFDGRNEDAILRLALTSVPRVGRCHVLAGYRMRDGHLERVPAGPHVPGPELDAQVGALRDEGAVQLPGWDWAWVYSLRGLGGRHGCLVAAAADQPSEDERFLLRVLAQQTGAALSNAVLHRTEREQAAQLRALNAELEAVNAQLSASVLALQRQRKIHEVLSRISATGEDEVGIAKAVHQLTGLPVAVEDRFGNLRAWAGPGRPDPYPKQSERRRSQVLANAVRQCRPVRDGDRVVALAQPRAEVLGVLALVDPGRVAGEHEMFALEHGAVVLAEELAHQRSLAEVELRMRRDLVDDLLNGTADDSAYARAEVLGHDLHRSHRVIVVQWDGGVADGDIAQAVERAAAAAQLGCLSVNRRGTVVLLAHHGTDCPGRAEREQWDAMYRAIARELRSGSGAMGVGGRADSVADIRRSHEEATRALAIRQGSVTSDGVTVFDELGVYRVLAAGDGTREVQGFVREWLGPLLDYDAGHRCELVRTLSTYLECGGRYNETADALTIHRSTLRYRLQRIREISGHDLAEVDSRFNLHVATRAWRVLDGFS